MIVDWHYGITELRKDTWGDAILFRRAAYDVRHEAVRSVGTTSRSHSPRNPAIRHGESTRFRFGRAGEDTEASDLDLLVDPGERTTLFDLDNRSKELKALLSVSVDVVTSTGLHERIRGRVLDEAKPV